jgi:hypothetical protein
MILGLLIGGIFGTAGGFAFGWWLFRNSPEERAAFERAFKDGGK